MGKNKFTFYAVARGRKVGLFSTWDECKTHVNGFNGAKYRGFHSKEDAQRYETRFNFGYYQDFISFMNKVLNPES